MMNTQHVIANDQFGQVGAHQPYSGESIASTLRVVMDAYESCALHASDLEVHLKRGCRDLLARQLVDSAFDRVPTSTIWTLYRDFAEDALVRHAPSTAAELITVAKLRALVELFESDAFVALTDAQRGDAGLEELEAIVEGEGVAGRVWLQLARGAYYFALNRALAYQDGGRWTTRDVAMEIAIVLTDESTALADSFIERLRRLGAN